MKNLNEFMLLFRLEPSNEKTTPEQLTEMHEHWGKFIGGIASQAKLVSTTRLGFEGNLIDDELRVNKGIAMSENKTLSGNMVLKASSLEEATDMAKGCPILKMGGTVEVRSVLPMES